MSTVEDRNRSDQGPASRSRKLLPRRVAEQLARRFASLPSSLAFSLCSMPWLEDRFLRPRYEDALRRHASRLPAIDDVQARIVEDIRRRGVAVTSLDELRVPGAEELMASARSISRELNLLSLQPQSAGKHTLQATASQLMEHPAIFRWGLARRILEIIECYLGLPVAYDGLSYYYSVADGRQSGPRRWHRDREDRRMIKMALYVRDVDDDGGPFQSLLPASSALVGDPGSPPGMVLSDDQVARRLAGPLDDHSVTCTGPAGTIFFADTARYFHRGKPPIRADRSAVFFSYFARSPRYPFLCQRSPLSARQIAELVADLPAEQRKAALWHGEVPAPMRWIPKNFVKV